MYIFRPTMQGLKVSCVVFAQTLFFILNVLFASNTAAFIVSSTSNGFVPIAKRQIRMNQIVRPNRGWSRGCVMQLFPGFQNIKLPNFFGEDNGDAAYHESRVRYHEERIRYHQDRIKFHKDSAFSKRKDNTLRPQDKNNRMYMTSGKLRILFVDLGNVCRSPASEAVFKTLAQKEGRLDQFVVSSCSTGGGTTNWFKPEVAKTLEENPPDPRMTSHAIKRGVNLSGMKSRVLTREDILNFDLIVGMDEQNRKDVLAAAEYWGLREEAKRKFALLSGFCRSGTRTTDIPDPYYGGDAGRASSPKFEKVLDLIEDACRGLLQQYATAS